MQPVAHSSTTSTMNATDFITVIFVFGSLKWKEDRPACRVAVLATATQKSGFTGIPHIILCDVLSLLILITV